MLDSILKEGWEPTALLFGIVFWLARLTIYKMIFNPLAGEPKSYEYEDIKRWYRSISFSGAVVVAPLFEEAMFTWLAYKVFLSYAQVGKEGVVIIAVALFFALLHLPGDLSRMRYFSNSRGIYLLIKFQLSRFFYSLAAYYIYLLTDQLLLTIVIHYVYNVVVSLNKFDFEDSPDSFEKRDGRLFLSRFMNLGFTLISAHFFYFTYPELFLFWVALPACFILYDFLRAYFR